MKATINNKEIEFKVVSISSKDILISIDDREYFFSKNELDFNIELFNEDSYQVFDGDLEAYIKLHPKVVGAANATAAEGSLVSPMPGKIFKILKEVGQEVEKGETILIMEAMKMEHSIKATSSGVVKKIFFKEGEQVTGGSLLCELE